MSLFKSLCLLIFILSLMQNRAGKFGSKRLVQNNMTREGYVMSSKAKKLPKKEHTTQLSIESCVVKLKLD